ncbi:phosphoenolpyruvate kinase, partial [bacterium]|nr:phosphoenolpyruvate kinase [bacterium]
MASTFENFDIKNITNELDSANEYFVKIYPGESNRRQPVHTVYGGANLFKSETAKKIGGLANKSL